MFVDLQNAKKRAARRGWPIHGYVGPNGSGKTAAMVWDSLPTLAAGRAVLSTVRLLDFDNPRPCEGCSICNGEPMPGHMQAHPLWIPFTDWEQLLDAESVDVLMDEVTGVASSRESHAMPAPVANKLVQLRRADVVVRWSAPNWARADKIIRECSQAVTYAQGYMPVSVQGEGEDRLWRTRRLFKWKTYDAADFEDFTVGKREQLRPLTVDWHWGPRSPVFGAYDTFDAVLSIGTVTDSGRCYRCGGRRSVPQCRCDDGASRGRRAAAAEAGPPEGDTEAGAVPDPGGRRRLTVIGE